MRLAARHPLSGFGFTAPHGLRAVLWFLPLLVPTLAVVLAGGVGVDRALIPGLALLAAMFSRLRETSVAMPPGEPGRPTLRAWLVELMLAVLPLDDARRALQPQSAAFSDQAAYDPDLGRAIAASDAEIRGSFAALVHRARAEGDVAADGPAPDVVGRGLLAVLQGLTSQQLYDPIPAEEVRALLDELVAALLPGVDGPG